MMWSMWGRKLILAFSVLPVLILCRGVTCLFGLSNTPANVATVWLALSVYGTWFWWCNR